MSSTKGWFYLNYPLSISDLFDVKFRRLNSKKTTIEFNKWNIPFILEISAKYEEEKSSAVVIRSCLKYNSKKNCIVGFDTIFRFAEQSEKFVGDVLIYEDCCAKNCYKSKTKIHLKKKSSILFKKSIPFINLIGLYIDVKEHYYVKSLKDIVVDKIEEKKVDIPLTMSDILFSSNKMEITISDKK